MTKQNYKAAGMTLTPYGNFPESYSFSDSVGLLQRPYTALSEQEYARLVSAGVDVFMDNWGNLYAYGDADAGKALMPIQESRKTDILKSDDEDRTETEQKIIVAIRECRANGITDPAKMAKRIADALKRKATETEFVIGDLHAVRVVGSELGRRGAAATKYGWIIKDKETGKEVERLVPNHVSGVTAVQARSYVENLVQLRALKAKANG